MSLPEEPKTIEGTYVDIRLGITRRSFLEKTTKTTLLLSAGPAFFMEDMKLPASPANRESDLESGFVNPPHSAKPWAGWAWLNGNISREGITADLEAMKTAGLCGAWLQTDESAKRGPIRFMTSEWRELFHHAVTEAARLGLAIDMATNDGYDCGGPWITPDHAMQKLVWTETQVQGPRELSMSLPQASANLNYYRDIAVIAYRIPTDEEDISDAVACKVEVSRGNPAFILHEYERPLTARGITVVAWPPYKGSSDSLQWELQVSDDGSTFRTIVRFELEGYVPKTFPIEEVRARYFRLLAPFGDALKNPDLPPAFLHGYDQAGFRLFRSARLRLWEQKAGFINAVSIDGQDGPPAPVKETRLEDVIDITSHMKDGGGLDWNVPEGNWWLLRIGHTPTGKLIGSATQEGKGLVVDTLSRVGVESNFQGMMQKLLEDSKPFVGKALRYFHLDSWEAGEQNWTREMRQEFQRRRGYDMTPYLPVMTGGRIIESAQKSERFLWDLRRTIADLIAENYWGRLTEFCHAHGLRFTGQTANSYTQFMCDPLLSSSKVDVPMCEFWFTEQAEELWPECKLVPSAAHAYGKKIIAAEAFTSLTGGSGGYSGAGQWREHPFSLKSLGDKAYCSGINRFFLSHYTHQPDLNAKPGLMMVGQDVDSSVAGQNVTPTGMITGTNFDRTQTWWVPGSAWIRYLTRCQYLLQEGTYVADLCVLLEEGAPSTLKRPKTLPLGYEFDCINLEVLQQAKVTKDRALTLSSGTSYRLLVLPESSRMTPVLARRVKELVKAGAVVVGPKPSASPSLSGYPRCDDEVRRIADELWDSGEVLQMPIPKVLSMLDLKPDLEFKGKVGDEDLRFIHRRCNDYEIYFISNQKSRFEEIECTFRVSGKVPELWDPNSGRIVESAVYEGRDGRLLLPLRMDPYGSIFVVFRKPAAAEPIVSVTKNGVPFPQFINGLGDAFQGVELTVVDEEKIALTTTQPGNYEFTSQAGKKIKTQVPQMPVLDLNGSWEVNFPAKWGAPEKIVLSKLISWTEHSDEGVRHFSGTATYVKDFEIPEDVIREDLTLYLDLGKVEIIAEILCNGKNVGIQWKPPFRVDISDAAQSGKNRLEVKVTNLWPNRLIGDQKLPEGKRFTQTDWNPYTSESLLLRSGLLGPVQVHVASMTHLHLHD